MSYLQLHSFDGEEDRGDGAGLLAHESPFHHEDEKQPEEHVKLPDVLGSNLIIVDQANSLHLIQKAESWYGLGSMYICGFSGVLLSLALWNILTVVFGLIMCSIAISCFTDTSCSATDTWAFLLLLYVVLQLVAVVATVQLGGPYYRDLHLSIDRTMISRHTFWPLPRFLNDSRKTRGFATGKVEMPRRTIEGVYVVQDYEIRSGHERSTVHKLMVKDVKGREINLSSP